MSVRSGNSKRFNSRRPLGSKMTSSTAFAWAEYSAKFTPSPSHVAPSGYGRPGHTSVGVIMREPIRCRSCCGGSTQPRRSRLFACFLFVLARPAFEPVGRPLLAADSEREGKPEGERGEDDQEALSNDVAETELIERGQHDEYEHCPEREPTDGGGIGERDALAIGGDRGTDEAREICAECK